MTTPLPPIRGVFLKTDGTRFLHEELASCIVPRGKKKGPPPIVPLLSVEEGDESLHLSGRNLECSITRTNSINSQRYKAPRSNAKILFDSMQQGWTGERLQQQRQAFRQMWGLQQQERLTAQGKFSLDPEQLTVTRGLGCGGFGTVVEVMLPPAAGEESPQIFYAMKVLNKCDIDGPKERTTLLRELRVLAAIPRHPLLLHCYLAFETPNTVNFVADMINGGDLFYHLNLLQETQNQAGFKEYEAKAILAEVVMALDHLHRHNFIHRDIKVENVMLDAKGHVKLIDFGLAFDLKSDTASHSPSLCLLYLPPELRCDHSRDRKFGRFTDWWAFGTLAFELLTGMCEWEDHDERSLRTKIQSLTAVRLNPFEESLTEFVNPFITKLLKRNYKERLGSSSSSEVMEDAFFAEVDWEAVDEGRATPRYVPDNEMFSGATDPEESQAALEKYKTLRSEASLVHHIQERTLEGKSLSWGYIGLKQVEVGPGFLDTATAGPSRPRQQQPKEGSPRMPSLQLPKEIY